MFKCMLIKRKLYDYLDKTLSETDKINVEAHLNICLLCQARLTQMRNLIELAENKATPQPSEDFWYDFRIELDRKLNAQLVPNFISKTNLSYRLKPALAYALVSLVILVSSISFYHFYNKPSAFVKKDLDIINTVRLLDEVAPELTIDQSEDAYLEELNLFYQFDQNSLQS